MTEEERRTAPAGGPPPSRARRSLPDHPVRVALLDLLAELGTVTSTQAAARLGHSSGLCSFHLRQLARHGLIEEAPHSGGRARPWRLRWEPSRPPEQGPRAGFDTQAGWYDTIATAGTAGTLARDLEDESYRHWLAHRDQAPAEWQQDESFSAVLHLTPAELTDLAAAIRGLLAEYRDQNRGPAGHPADMMPVAAVTRLFPLLPESPARPSRTAHRDSDEPTG